MASYRTDDVPISLRKAYDSPFPSDEEVLMAIKERVQELTLTKHGASTLKNKAAQTSINLS